MLSQTFLILILCLFPLLCQSKECSDSCLSNKDQAGDPLRWNSRCLQFYGQKNTIKFDKNTTCSDWNTVYDGLSDIFMNIFHLNWRSLESNLKGAGDDECSTNTLGRQNYFAKIFNDKISRIDLLPTGSFCPGGAICNLRPTCPIGLITSVLCLVDLDKDHVCNSAGTVPYCGVLPYICEDDMKAVIKLCLDDDLHDETFESLRKIMPVSRSMPCSSPDFIYLGQPSNRVLSAPTIVVTCISEDTANLTCFNGGQRVESATWEKNITSYVSTNGIATIKVQDDKHHLVNGHYACFDDGVELVTDNISLHCHHKEVTEDIPDEDEASSEASPENTEEFVNFWTNETIWPEEDLTDINALNNIDYHPGTLSVVQIVVNGRLTPVCGEDWSMKAANVFCNELGKRNNQSWTATFVGTIPRLDDTINLHYNPYIRDIDCKGDEEHLIYCNHTGWGIKSCQHHAVVICEAKEPEPKPTSSLLIGIAIAAVGVVFFIVVLVLVWRYWKHCRENKPDNSVTVIYNPETAPPSTGTTDADGLPTTEPPLTEATEPPSSDFYSSMINSDCSIVMTPALRPVAEIKYIVKKILRQCPAVLIVDVIRAEGSMKVIAKELNEGKSQEYPILKDLDHLNVIKTLLSPANVTVDKFGQDNKSPRMFFIEYCNLGDLDYHLNNNGHGHDMSSDHMLSVILGLAKALSYLHNKNIVHGDVKADNVVLQIEQGKMIPKLTDFGLSFKTSDVHTKPWGTCLYMAPELLIGDGDFSRPIKSDIYSFGMLSWEVLSWMACDANKTRPRHVSATSNDSGIQTGETILTLSDVTEADVELLEMGNTYTSDYDTSHVTSTQDPSMFVNTSKKNSGCRLKVHTAMIEQLQRNRGFLSVSMTHETKDVNDLRSELEKRNLSTKGLKIQLVARLQKALKDEIESGTSPDSDEGMLKRPTKDVMTTFYNKLQATLPTPNTHGWDTKCFPWAVDVIAECCKEVSSRCSADTIIKLIEERSLYLSKDS